MKRFFLRLTAILLCLGAAGGAPASAVSPGGLAGLFSGFGWQKKEWIVGTDIAFEDVTEFYYTYDFSTAMPLFQRYRFYVEGGKTLLYHETREGGGWPQTEEDITVSGTVELTEEQIERFHGYLEGGTVQRRQEHLDDGDAGPWLFLYWTGDEGDIQEFAFESWGKEREFEDFCAALRDGT